MNLVLEGVALFFSGSVRIVNITATVEVIPDIMLTVHELVLSPWRYMVVIYCVTSVSHSKQICIDSACAVMG